MVDSSISEFFAAEKRDDCTFVKLKTLFYGIYRQLRLCRDCQ